VSVKPAVAKPISLKKDAITYIAGQLNLTYEDTKLMITNVLQDALDWTLEDMKEWIKEFVPKRTGQLQDNLLANIESSRVVDFTLKLIIRTSIDYAADVNAMSDAQVQHDATWFEHSGKRAYAYYYGNYGPIFLNDPNAMGGFFQELQEYGKQRSFVNLAKAKARHYGSVFHSPRKGTYYKPPSGKYLVM
jgi:hypothetical protein